MPIVAPNNNYLLGLSKQTNEATVPTVANYTVPVYSSSFGPMYDDRRVQVTDASSIQGDAYKGQTSWGGEAEFPAFAESLGRFLQALWPTDAITGAGPYTHTFSGLGGTQSWISLYSEWPGAGALEQTFGKGQATGIGFTAAADGGPLRVRFAAMGSTPTVAAYTVTTADDLTDGYFTLQASGATIELDVDTPNANPSVAAVNVQDVTINVDREASVVQTADGITSTNISSGLVAPGGTMTLLWADWDAYRATYFGAVGGSAASSVVVTGALALLFKHTTQATWTFELYIPAVQFRVGIPEPSPDGGPLTLPVTLNIQKPTTGSHVQPILVNAVTPAYT